MPRTYGARRRKCSVVRLVYGEEDLVFRIILEEKAFEVRFKLRLYAVQGF